MKWKYIGYGLRSDGTIGVIDRKHPAMFKVPFSACKKMVAYIKRDLWKGRVTP